MEQHRYAIERVADALMQHGELTGDQVRALTGIRPPPPPMAKQAKPPLSPTIFDKRAHGNRVSKAWSTDMFNRATQAQPSTVSLFGPSLFKGDES